MIAAPPTLTDEEFRNLIRKLVHFVRENATAGRHAAECGGSPHIHVMRQQCSD